MYQFSAHELTDPAALGMQRHPEGGWYLEHYRSDRQVATSSGTRSLATAISFLLLPGEHSAWHRVRSDELWFWQGGGRLELDLGGDGARPGNATTYTLGTGGQLLVPAGVWQAARPADDQAVIVGCVVAPGFDFADFELADAPL